LKKDQLHLDADMNLQLMTSFADTLPSFDDVMVTVVIIHQESNISVRLSVSAPPVVNHSWVS
jgi:hypothetical protein